ncbi:MAG: histidinol dehydrogenase, partial [Planctomycetota bacterium]
MSSAILKTIDASQMPSARRGPVDDEAVSIVRPIIEDIQADGEAAVRLYAEKLDGLAPGAPLLMGKDVLADALKQIDPGQRELLERVAGRIRSFAQAQRDALASVERPIPGGAVGHWIAA